MPLDKDGVMKSFPAEQARVLFAAPLPQIGTFVFGVLAPPAMDVITPPEIVIVLLSGLTAPGAELVATGRSAGTKTRKPAAPDEPFGVATI
jgi:hypothetical protein